VFTFSNSTVVYPVFSFVTDCFKAL